MLNLNILNKVLKKYFKELNIDINQNSFVENVVMDSQLVKENTMFIAINNGNQYIDEAILKGASFIITDRKNEKYLNASKVIYVKNSVLFMQELAKRYRENLDIIVIGITGSEGKTTTKDFIAGVLSAKYKVKKSLGNYNNHIGLPYTILQIKAQDEIAVLEMGMNHLGEIDRLSEISKPNYAVITNIGDSHLEILKNRENVFKAKTEILNYVDKDKIILYGDDKYLNKLDGIKIGFNKNNDFIISHIEENFEYTKFKLNGENYKILLNGDYNVINSSFGIVFGKIFKMSENEIKNSLKKIEISKMRFEKIEKNDIFYINDAYNASPVSMKMAINTFANLSTDKKKIVVLGDMLELGENEIDFHKKIIQNCLKNNFYKIYLYGDRMKKAFDNIEIKNIMHFEKKEDIIDELLKEKDLMVLLKGSRGMKLEEIIK